MICSIKLESKPSRTIYPFRFWIVQVVISSSCWNSKISIHSLLMYIWLQLQQDLLCCKSTLIIMVFNSKEYAKQYYIKNREKILARTNAYNQAHREEKRLKDRLAYHSKKKKYKPIVIDQNIKISFQT